MRGIPGAVTAWARFDNIVDAGTAAARWVQSAGAAQTRFTEGVQATQKDPTALAVQAQGKLVTNFNQAVGSGRWARALGAVGSSGWKAATVAKAANYSTGIQASQDKYLAAIGPVLAIEAQLQSQIAAMPNNNINDSIARSAAWQMGLHNWAASR